MVPEASLLLALLGALSADAASPTPSTRREAVVLRTKDDGRWHRVRLPGGDEGFVQRGDLVPGEASDWREIFKGARRPR